MTREEAEEHQKNQGYLCGFYKLNDQGQEVWRRVVFPKPKEIIEIDIIESCLQSATSLSRLRRRHSGGRNRTSKSRGVGTISMQLRHYPSKSLDAPQAIVYCGVEGVIDKDLSSSRWPLLYANERSVAEKNWRWCL